MPREQLRLRQLGNLLRLILDKSGKKTMPPLHPMPQGRFYSKMLMENTILRLMAWMMD